MATTTETRVIKRAHLFGPIKQAELDYAEGMDIGYNPYPPESDNWVKYRDSWNDCYLKELYADQEIAAMGGEPTGD